MRYGISVPNFGDYADPNRLAAFARVAEQSGWDGLFVWDHLTFMPGVVLPIADPWILLAAIACRTERIRIGALITPVARRRPWKLAREVTTLDHLSGGRVVFGAGLGEPFDFAGTHFRIEEVTFQPTPVQEHLPVWIAGTWPHRRPFRRAARWDGVVPQSATAGWDESMPVDEVRAMLGYIREHQTEEGLARPFDVVIGGYTTGTDHTRDERHVRQYVDAGATWWLENLNGFRGSFEEMEHRLRLGPPRV